MPVFIEGCLEWCGGKNFVGVVIHIAKKGVHAEIDAAFPCFIVVVEIVVICLRMKRKGDDLTSYFRQNNDLPKLSGAYARPLALKELKRVMKIYERARRGADERTRAFYEYQIDKVERLMKK